MANTPTSDLQAAKLIAHYPTSKKALGDLLFTYWNDAAGGNNAGVPKVGQALYDHYGGSEVTLSDRAQRFWTNYV